MKSIFAANTSRAIPEVEKNSCSYLRRNHDIIFSSMLDLFFCIEFVGHYICRNEYHIERSLNSLDNDSVLLLLTISGQGKLVYHDAEYTLTRGSCILLDLANQHEYYTVGDHWEFKYLHFEGSTSKKYITYVEKYSKPVFTLLGNEFLHINRTLDRLLDITEEAFIRDYAEISGLIYAMLMCLLSHNNNKNSIESVRTKAIQAAVTYIRQNYMCNISTEDISRAANLSRSYMSELFTHAYGIPPHEYLVQFRLSIAKDLLMHSTLPISVIAEKTGFRDIFSLSRSFKREIGVSPTQYRQKHNKGQ